MEIGQSRPVNPVDEQVRGDAALVKRVADLERALQRRSPLVAGRNLLRNGEHQVHQRIADSALPLSAAVTLATAYHAQSDLWVINDFIATHVSCGNFVYSTDPSGNGTGTGYGDLQEFNNVLVINPGQKVSLAAGDFLIVQQAIEARNIRNLRSGTSHAQPLTLSFTATSFADFNGVVELEYASGRKCSQPYFIAAGTRTRHVVTFPADPAGPLIGNTTGVGMNVYFWLAAGTTYTGGGTLNNVWTTGVAANKRAVGLTNIAAGASNQFDFTGVQLEYGNVATPFEHKPFDQEFEECRRYFQRWTQPPLRGVRATGGTAIGSRMGMPLPVSMRVPPTVSISGPMPVYDGATTSTFSTIATNYSTTDVVEIDTGATGLPATTGGGPAGLVIYQTGTNYMDLSAELV